MRRNSWDKTDPMDAPLSPRVAALEVSVRALSNDVESVRGSVEQLSANVISGFAEIRRDFAAAGRTNWGWIIAAVAVIIALVGAVGSAWIRPLQQVDEVQAMRINELYSDLRETRDLIIRYGERMDMYHEYGLPKKRK